MLLGERSYAFGLLHQLIMRVWAHADRLQVPVTSTVVAVLWFAVVLVLAVAAASALIRLVEVPLERRLRARGHPGWNSTTPEAVR